MNLLIGSRKIFMSLQLFFLEKEGTEFPKNKAVLGYRQCSNVNYVV